MQECDTDGDGTPDPFDRDSDSDGVPDRMDQSAANWTDLNGIHRSGYSASSVAPFNRASSMNLWVKDLVNGWPAYVDLQLRPTNAAHLSYSMGILDWPSDATQGQIQHVRGTTFGEYPETAATADEPGKHGDMRLVPMLEVEIGDTSVPLSMTVPAANIVVGSDTSLATTVDLKPSPSDATKTLFTLTLPASNPTVDLYTGTCDLLSVGLATKMQALTSGTIIASKLVDLADGNHFVVVSSGTASACGDLPNVINGAYSDRMVDMSLLAQYGISLREVNSTATSPLLMYAPLNIVPDDTGGGQTAFQAHLVYWPDTGRTWNASQKVNIVWAVQALTDRCNSDTFQYEDLEDYQDKTGDKDAEQDDYDKAFDADCAKLENRLPDDLQVVNIYDDDWFLAGMSVREDHGMDIAAAYINPNKTFNESYPQPEEDLWQLALGLSGSFLNQRDCEKAVNPAVAPYDADTAASYDPANDICSSDGLRDVSVAKRNTVGTAYVGNSTIGERWDADTKSTYPWTSIDRWEIPAKALKVQTVHYRHQDQLAEVPTKLTAGILSSLGDAYGTVITPTIMFAREEYFRSAGTGSRHVEWRQQTVDGRAGYRHLQRTAPHCHELGAVPLQYAAGPGNWGRHRLGGRAGDHAVGHCGAAVHELLRHEKPSHQRGGAAGQRRPHHAGPIVLHGPDAGLRHYGGPLPRAVVRHQTDPQRQR